MTARKPRFLTRRAEVGSYDLADPAPVELDDREPTVCGQCGRKWTKEEGLELDYKLIDATAREPEQVALRFRRQGTVRAVS